MNGLIDPKEILTTEQVESFFSQTDEFKVKEAEQDCVSISLTSSGKVTNTLVYKPSINIQQLIRTITQLQYNMIHDILD